MQKLIRILSLILAIVMLAGLLGCAAKPAVTPDATLADPEQLTSEETVAEPRNDLTSTETATTDEVIEWHRNAEGKIEVVAANTQSLTSLDFMDGADGGMVRCMWDMIYDTLIDDANQNGDYQPRLATSWEHTDDYKEWTFKLREGVTFHSGNPFTSYDVAVTMQRILDNKGKLKRITGLWTYLDSYEVIDGYTIKLYFSETYGIPFMDLAKMPILDGKAYEEMGGAYFTDGYLSGTGKWKFKDFVDGQYISVEKSDNYWNPDWSTNVDVFTLRFITEASSMTSGLLSGEIDAVARVDSDQALLLQNNPDLTMGITHSTSFIFLGFQCGSTTDSPFKETNVRKAFSYAIDRQAICDNILGGGTPMMWWFPEGVVGYREKEVIYNPDLAKELLADSNYNGEEILIYVNTVATAGESIMLAVCDMARAVGFNCKIQMGDQAFLSQVRTNDQYIAYCVTGTAVVDYGNDTYQKWVNKEDNKGYWNCYENEEFAALLDEMDTTADREKRDELEAQIAQIMYDEVAPGVPILRYDFYTCVRNGLKGVLFPPSGYYYFDDIYLE